MPPTTARTASAGSGAAFNTSVHLTDESPHTHCRCLCRGSALPSPPPHLYHTSLGPPFNPCSHPAIGGLMRRLPKVVRAFPITDLSRSRYLFCFPSDPPAPANHSSHLPSSPPLLSTHTHKHTRIQNTPARSGSSTFLRHRAAWEILSLHLCCQNSSHLSRRSSTDFSKELSSPLPSKSGLP